MDEILQESTLDKDGSARSCPNVRVAIVLPALGAGGTEHVVSVLANQWARRGWSVTIMTLEPSAATPYYSLHPHVQTRRLGLPPKRRSALPALVLSIKRILALRQALIETAPDVVLSFLTRTNVMTLIAARNMNLNVVISERNNPAKQNVGPVWRALRAQFYPRAFALVTPVKGAQEYFSHAMQRRRWVIPNPVDLTHAGERRSGGNVLAAVGRLVPQKGFDLLLQAFGQVSPHFPEWTLVIWGEGPERARLEAERDRWGLQGRVEMPGVTQRPGTWIDAADAFVLSSRFEGWGIALLEAMAAELPVISFDCEWGPREMIEDGKNGLLVEPGNVDALARAIRRLLSDRGLRRRLATAAGKSARLYTQERVMKQWDEVVHAAMAERPPGRAETGGNNLSHRIE